MACQQYTASTFPTQPEPGDHDLGAGHALLFANPHASPYPDIAQYNVPKLLCDDLDEESSDLSSLTPTTDSQFDDLWTPLFGGQAQSIHQSPGFNQLDCFDDRIFAADQITSKNQLGPPSAEKTCGNTSTHNGTPTPQIKKRRKRRKKVRTEEEVQRKREDFLERNRKAAQKCRQRKKLWLEDVQQKRETSSSMMNMLSAQVIHLLGDVKNLRAVVDAHQASRPADFDVFKRQPITDNISVVANPTIAECRAQERMTEGNPVSQMHVPEEEEKPLLEQQHKSLSEPCLKLALEASRRFSEMYPRALSFQAQTSSPKGLGGFVQEPETC